MMQFLTGMLVGWAGLTALAKDLPYHDFTRTLDADMTAVTNAEPGWLVASWGRPDGHWSPLFLMRCPAAQSLASGRHKRSVDEEVNWKDENETKSDYRRASR